MMQVQKGQVKYKDRSDIICTYGVVNGKKYFFLEGETLPEDLIVVTTELIEAIDPMIPATHIGVLDKEGNEIIPPVNKSVRLVNKSLLVVEKAVPTSPSVTSAINIRKDPLAATKLVTTVATIKDKFTSKMGGEGKYIINDQFSEAAVYDLDGKILFDGELYSFICVKDNYMYLSKNTVDSLVVKYDILEKKIVDDNVNNEEVDEKEKIDSKDGSLENEKASLDSKVILQGDLSDKKESVKEDEEKEEEVIKKDEDVDVDSLVHPVDLNAFPHTFDMKLPFPGSKVEKEEEDDSDSDDPFFKQMTKTVKKLINQVKDQKDMLALYEEKIESLTNFKRKAFDENKNLVGENEALKKQIKAMDAKLEEKDRLLEEAQDEISELREQVAGRRELAKVLEDAKDLLEEDREI